MNAPLLCILSTIETDWREYQDDWKECERCPLCEDRKKVVLARGKLPAHVLFVGEAPGTSEDSIGYAFVGPAGQKANEIIQAAFNDLYPDETFISSAGSIGNPRRGYIRFAFANIVGCIPWNEEGDGVRPPTKTEAKTCQAHLTRLIELAEPVAIVTLGKVATRLIPDTDVPTVEAIHPAAILREKSIPKANLSFKRSVKKYAQAFRMVRFLKKGTL